MDLSLLTLSSLAQSAPTLAMTWNPVVTNVLVGVFLIVSIAMILLVLIQRPQGGGLSGAFGAGGGGGGGGGAGQTAFGTKTGDVLTGATITIFVLFLITAIVLNFATRPQLPNQDVPVATTPAEDAEPNAAETIQESNIPDPEQAVDDVMSSEPGIESDESEGEGSDAGENTPAASDEPASEEPATGDN